MTQPGGASRAVDTRGRRHAALLVSVAAVFAWAAIAPRDRFTFWLEVAPALVALVAIAATYRRFPLTDLTYALAALHACVLFVGGHYTYAEVPAFNWLRDVGLLARNDYDKVGHFVQGFVPAIVIREVLVRTSPLRPGKWLAFLVVSVATAISALYEMIEWWVGAASGSAGDAFLGTQGYVWDTQSDMFLCLVGACVALATLSRVHDRALARVGANASVTAPPAR